MSVTDDEALEGFQRLARTEGILCALESAHAIAALPAVAAALPAARVIVVSVSGRGDKDMGTIGQRLRRERCEPPRRDRLRRALAPSGARRWSST